MEHNQTITHADLEKHLKKTTIFTNVVGLVIAFFTAIFVVNGFYINTNKTLDSHTVELTEIKKEATAVKETLNNSKVTQGISGAEISAMKETITQLQTQQDKMNDKLDKILIQTK